MGEESIPPKHPIGDGQAPGPIGDGQAPGPIGDGQAPREASISTVGGKTRGQEREGPRGQKTVSDPAPLSLTHRLSHLTPPDSSGLSPPRPADRKY